MNVDDALNNNAGPPVMAVAMAMPAQQPPQQQLATIAVPPNTFGGQTINMQVEGSVYRVTIPHNLSAGDRFQIPVQPAQLQVASADHVPVPMVAQASVVGVIDAPYTVPPPMGAYGHGFGGGAQQAQVVNGNVQVMQRDGGGAGEGGLMALAVFSCLCCAWPCGLVAILKVSSIAHAVGDEREQELRRGQAKVWIALSFVMGLLFVWGSGAEYERESYNSQHRG